jgi:hypothetical protein
LPDLFFAFFFFFPTFIYSCGLGFIRISVPMSIFVFSRSEGFVMPPRRKPQKQPSTEFIKELAESLGRVFIAAANMEHLFGITIADLLKLNRLKHRAFIIPMSFSNKVSLIRQLGNEYLKGNQRKTLKILLTEFQACAELRNGLAHGFYGAKRGKFALITFSGEARFSGQSFEWQPSDLRKLVARIEAANRSHYSVRHLFPTPLKLPKNRKALSPSVER